MLLGIAAAIASRFVEHYRRWLIRVLVLMLSVAALAGAILASVPNTWRGGSWFAISFSQDGRTISGATACGYFQIRETDILPGLMWHASIITSAAHGFTEKTRPEFH